MKQNAQKAIPFHLEFDHCDMFQRDALEAVPFGSCNLCHYFTDFSVVVAEAVGGVYSTVADCSSRSYYRLYAETPANQRISMCQF